MTGAQVEGGALIVAAQQSRNVLDADFLIGLDAHGQVLDAVGKVQRRCKLLHDVEFADAVVLDLLDVVGATVGLPEEERFLAIPQFQFLGYIEHVVRCHVVVGVAEVEFANARDVGRDGNFVVGDAYGSPHGTHFLGASTEDLEQPCLVLVSDGKALATVAIAVFPCQLSHQADSVAGCGATLQSDA